MSRLVGACDTDTCCSCSEDPVVLPMDWSGQVLPILTIALAVAWVWATAELSGLGFLFS